jgi:2-keto-4-pentenoate hydratase
MASFDPKAAARAIAEAHAKRQAFRNLEGDLAPPTIGDAYAAQEALAEIWSDERGPVRGLKIATTTKVMQDLMGIDHPCGGMIFEKRMHASPARLSTGDYVHLVAECELAVRLGHDLDGPSGSHTRETVRAAVREAMAAFELIEDRNAVYKETDAKTLIADDAWNAGIVTGLPVRLPADVDLNGIAARLFVDGKLRDEGRTDDPMGALAWIANLAAERRRPLKAGMVVITGSVVATLPIEVGETFKFEIDGIADVEMTLAA